MLNSKVIIKLLNFVFSLGIKFGKVQVTDSMSEAARLRREWAVSTKIKAT